MKKLLFTIVAAFAALLSDAKAITLVDIDTFSWEEGNLSANEELTRVFTLSPFDPDSQEVISGKVTFVFADILSPLALNSVDINLGDVNFVEGGFRFFALVGPAGLSTEILGDLNADGQLEYTIKNTGTSDFNVVSAALTANVINGGPAPQPQAVPDGGSMVAMLGLSMAGLGFLRRKFMVA